MNEPRTPTTSADAFLRDLLEKQPGLIGPLAPSAEAGKHVGDFIAALRQRLIEMYSSAPRQ